MAGLEAEERSSPRLVRAATSITLDTALLEALAEVSTYITAPIC